MNNLTLSGPERAPKAGGAPKQLIVFLHGLGADGNDLIGLTPLFAEQFPHAQFLSPDAPYPCDMAPYGRQWFSLREWTPPSMLAGVTKVAPILNRYLDDQLARFNLTDDKLALIGFSQGTMTSLYTALRRTTPCAGIVGYSGAMIGEDGIISKPPVCLIHGTADEVVPFAAMAHAQSILSAHHIAVETHARPGLGHGIDPEGIEAAATFLQTRLA